MRILLFLFLILFLNNSFSDPRIYQSPAPDTTKPNPIPPPGSILIIGDSQSAIVTASGQKINWTWPNILQQQLKDCGVKIDVVALGGKTSKWMLEEGKKKLLTGHWDRVIIYGGGNDASNMSIPLETTISNFQKLIDLANSDSSEVWVNLGWKIEGKFMDMDILPIGRPANLLKKKSDWIPYIEKRKNLQVMLKEKLINCQFIEPYDLQSKTSDGIHPTAEGHKLVSNFILQTIDTTGCK
jgi:lysophospholipase L1-like esterase